MFGLWSRGQIVLLFGDAPLPVSGAHANAAGAKAGCDGACFVGEEDAMAGVRTAALDRAQSGRAIEPAVNFQPAIAAERAFCFARGGATVGAEEVVGFCSQVICSGIAPTNKNKRACPLPRWERAARRLINKTRVRGRGAPHPSVFAVREASPSPARGRGHDKARRVNRASEWRAQTPAAIEAVRPRRLSSDGTLRDAMC